MKEGDIYLHEKSKFLFRVEKIYNEPTILMSLIGYDDMVVDTMKVWKDLKMKKLFP
jgi:hypothetical protein